MRASENSIERLHSFINASLSEKEPEYYEYDEWKIFHNPELLLLVTQLLYKKVKLANLEFDYIGALGGSGSPLAISLVLEFLRNGSKKNFLYVSDPLFGVSSLWVMKIKPDIVKPRPSVLFVDTEVKSGRTIFDGCEKVRSIDANISGIAVITDYKGFQDRTDYNKIVNSGQVPLVRLFDFYPSTGNLVIAK